MMLRGAVAESIEHSTILCRGTISSKMDKENTTMITSLKSQWDKIRKSILRKWGHRIDEADLQEPMSYEELCDFFGQQCRLSRDEARKEAERVLREVTTLGL
jgi:hypothetical protein